MKKITIIAFSIVGFLPLLSFAQDAGSTTTIQMPTNFAIDVVANAGAFFSSWNSYVVILAGTILGVTVLEILVGLFRK